MMKKLFLSSVTIIAFVLYIVYYRTWSGNFGAPNPVSNTAANTDTIGVTGRQPLYKDGRYTGISADAYYGRVQVEVVVNQGFITEVVFLDRPHEQSTSLEVNGRAVPILRSEAIAVQNAQVDTVSGATQTSRAFRESLASALAQAKL